jgi:hypothetical protein
VLTATPAAARLRRAQIEAAARLTKNHSLTTVPFGSHLIFATLGMMGFSLMIGAILVLITAVFILASVLHFIVTCGGLLK